MMGKACIVEVRDLTKKFGRLTALDKLDFDIFDKEIFGLLGPNGAGKSTFIAVLTTLCKPTAGDILVKGLSVTRQAAKIKKSIGFVPQDIALYPMLSGLDNLKFWAGIYGLTGGERKKRINEVLEIVRLEDRAKDRVETYSGGMKRRLNIAVSLLHQPELLIMDEPTVGVDIQSRKYILDAVKDIRDKGSTVVFTSHYIDEMESLCDRIAIINKGKISSIGTVEELLHNYDKNNLEEILLGLFDEGKTEIFH
ncbi:MAG: ABC transporter ATP-binding protein [Clostridia bacterium]|nr:ABC transporter ATP-binding protein [Clostridia bacterium]